MSITLKGDFSSTRRFGPIPAIRRLDSSPFWGMLHGRMKTGPLGWVLLTGLLATSLVPLVLTAAQRTDPPGAAAPAGEDETRRIIRDLNGHRRSEHKPPRIEKELELQRKILRRTLDDSRALQRSSELLTLIEKENADRANRQVVVGGRSGGPVGADSGALKVGRKRVD